MLYTQERILCNILKSFKYKMTLTMISDLLPHGARPVVFLDQVDVVDATLLLVMNNEALMKGGELQALLVNLTLGTPCLLPVGLET
jgi:hypothetical protein